MLPILVQIIRAQSFAEESSQLEDVAHLDASDCFQGLAAVGTALTRLGQGDVGQDVYLEVSGIVRAAQMGVRLVPAHHEVVAAGDGQVADAFDVVDPDGRCGAGHQPGFGDFLVVGQAQIAGVEGVF